MAGVKPKKSLGQNFLRDKNIAAKIVAALNPAAGDTVVEIGPGEGVLTEFLIERQVNLVAVELDSRAVEYLKEKFVSASNLKIVEKSILDFSPANYANAGAKLKVIGNIPYHISGGVIFWCLHNSQYIEKAVLTVQREVALRIASKPGTKDFGVVGAAIGLLGSGRKLFNIAPGLFYPPPKVVSAVVEIDLKNPIVDIKIFPRILALIKAAFNQRRKTLKNALAAYLSDRLSIGSARFAAVLDERNIDYLSRRAETLEARDFVKLFNLINEYGKNDRQTREK